MTEPSPSALSRSVLLAYALPALPFATLTVPLYVYLPTFYAQSLGLGLSAVGLALLAARFIDVLADPLVGFLSDRLVLPFGRRKPWMLVGAPLLALGAWRLFMPPAKAGLGGLFLWTLVLYLGGSLAWLTYTAWGAELSPLYHERTRVTAYRESFVVGGTVISASLPALVGGDSRSALASVAWLILVTLPPTVAFALFRVPDQAARRPSRTSERVGLAGLLAPFLANRPFQRLILAFLLNGIANGLPAGLFLLFIEQALALKAHEGILLFAYFLSGVLAVPLWLWLSYRLGKHRAWIASMIWASLFFAMVPLLGPGDFHAFLAIAILTGAAFGADLALPSSMQADVIDIDRLATGRQRAGLFFALWSMTSKLALALAVGIAFPILDLVGFRSEGPNGATAIATLAALYGLLPIAFKIAAIAAVWGFPLTAERQQAIRRDLAARIASGG